MARTRQLSASLLSSTLLLALGACTDAPDLGDQGLAFGGGNGCPEWGCSGNSPVIGPYESHELDLDGEPNSQGVFITGTEIGGVPVTVAFKNGDQLYATDGANTYTGHQLDHLTFHLRGPQGNFRMVVNTVTPLATSNTRFWVGNPDRIETYELLFAQENVPGDLRPVCKNPPPNESAATGEIWPNAFESVMFQGDRYDGVKKVVTAASFDESRNWFNIGCAGSVIAKMHLNRHTTAGSDADHATHREERQALLKMYVGDFCGEGYAFTEPGTPLHWENVFGWRKLTGNEVGFESWWTEKGAACLTEHRLGQQYYNDVMAACHLDPCDGNPFPKEWLHGAYVKSAIPQ